MRIPSVLRQVFPRLQYTCGTCSAHSLEIESQPWFSTSVFQHRSRSYRTPSTRHHAIKSLAGFSEHEEKVTSDLLCERLPAYPQKAALEAFDLDHILLKKSNGFSGRVWMERWTHFLCFLSCENSERPNQVDVANICFKDRERAKDTDEKFNVRLLGSAARAVDPLNWQFRLDKGMRTAGLTKRSAFTVTDTGLCHSKSYCSQAADGLSDKSAIPEFQDHSQRAVVIALWCNFFVLSLKCGVWLVTGSHVMLAEAVHSLADLANQALLAYGLVSSRRAPDDIHPYGYSKERFVWSLISAVGIFCLGSGATIVHGVSNLWSSELPDNIYIAALVLAGSMILEGASLIVAIHAVWKSASTEGMTMSDYVWRGHDPTAVAVMMEDGAAVTGLIIAALSLVAVLMTGNPIYDPIGSIFVGNLLGMVAIFLIQRNRHALIGRAMDNHDMKRVLDFLSSDPVVDAVYDCKSEVIGPCSYRFKAEIDFNGVAIVQNYLRRTGRETWTDEFRVAINDPDGRALDRVMSNYGEEVVLALGSEVDRLEKEIQRLVPGIRHVDIETHNPNGPSPF